MVLEPAADVLGWGSAEVEARSKPRTRLAAPKLAGLVVAASAARAAAAAAGDLYVVVEMFLVFIALAAVAGGLLRLAPRLLFGVVRRLSPWPGD
jgi:hypothetical protein